MLDEIKKAILRSGYTFPVIARHAKIAHNTIYGLFEPDANPTIGSLERIRCALLDMPNKKNKTCADCVHNRGNESDDEGEPAVLCINRSGLSDPNGCAFHETP